MGNTPIPAEPTLAPAVSPTPIFTAAASEVPVPTPLPTEQRNYELCVSIASDSNGYGHVTFLVPFPGLENPPLAITYITPLWVPLQEHLNALGLGYLQVIDRSLSAGGLTIASANYRASEQYYFLRQDRCQFVVITPFYPDVAVDLASPQYYVDNLLLLIDEVTLASPDSRLLVLNFYQTQRADYTVLHTGRGLREERIAAFNMALEQACAADGRIGQYPQVTCIDIRPFFEGMGTSYLLGPTTYQAFQASLYRESGYTPVIEDYFRQYPDGVIIGDGIHLSQSGRDRLAERLALVLLDLIRRSGTGQP